MVASSKGTRNSQALAATLLPVAMVPLDTDVQLASPNAAVPAASAVVSPGTPSRSCSVPASKFQPCLIPCTSHVYLYCICMLDFPCRAGCVHRLQGKESFKLVLGHLASLCRMGSFSYSSAASSPKESGWVRSWLRAAETPESRRRQAQAAAQTVCWLFCCCRPSISRSASMLSDDYLPPEEVRRLDFQKPTPRHDGIRLRLPLRPPRFEPSLHTPTHAPPNRTCFLSLINLQHAPIAQPEWIRMAAKAYGNNQHPAAAAGPAAAAVRGGGAASRSRPASRRNSALIPGTPGTPKGGAGGGPAGASGPSPSPLRHCVSGAPLTPAAAAALAAVTDGYNAFGYVLGGGGGGGGGVSGLAAGGLSDVAGVAGSGHAGGGGGAAAAATRRQGDPGAGAGAGSGPDSGSSPPAPSPSPPSPFLLRAGAQTEELYDRWVRTPRGVLGGGGAGGAMVLGVLCCFGAWWGGMVGHGGMAWWASPCRGLGVATTHQKCTTPLTPTKLCRRFGSFEGLSAAVDDFYHRLCGDPCIGGAVREVGDGRGHEGWFVCACVHVLRRSGCVSALLGGGGHFRASLRSSFPHCYCRSRAGSATAAASTAAATAAATAVQVPEQDVRVLMLQLMALTLQVGARVCVWVGGWVGGWVGVVFNVPIRMRQAGVQ